MALNYGVKVMQAGKAIDSANVRDIILSSKYTMLKYSSTSTGPVTFNQGDQTKYVDFSHSLGYVPAFIAYLSSTAFEDGKERMIPCFSWGGSGGHAYAYADSSKIRCYYELTNPYNQVTAEVSDGYTNSGTNNFLLVGDYGAGTYDCGYRFTGIGNSDVPLPSGTPITSAVLDFRVDGKFGASDTEIQSWGIDEDNVGAFGSDMGKTHTTASSTQSVSAGSGSFVGINNATAMAQEIIDRGSWSSGNAMGFYTFNNSSPSGCYIGDTLGGTDTKITILKTGSFVVTFRVIIFKDKIV